jgi:hypothetical protein
MKHNMLIYPVVLFVVFISIACSGPKIFKLGSNYGGIIENSNPAVSGDTQTGSTVSFQQTFLFKGHTFQTGIDYVSHRQRITYFDTLHVIDGTRRFNIHQLRVPLSYNVNILRDFDKVPTLIIHIGVSGGVTLSPGITEELRLGLPKSTLTRVDIGPQLGVTLQPLQLDYHHYLGVYVDFYRGTRIYNDIYHKDKGVGNLNFFKVGALLYFR